MRVECVVTRVVDRGYDRLLCLRQVGGDVGLLRDPIEIPFDHLGTGDSFAVGDHLELQLVELAKVEVVVEEKAAEKADEKPAKKKK